MSRMIRVLMLAFLCNVGCFAQSPVYVVLFFHVENSLTPQTDDAVLRLAKGLQDRGVRATFQFTGEKARTLEARGRRDVMRALWYHDIGYHSDFHSVQPVPAVYLRDMGWLEGAAEFERREGPGVADVRRIFGVNPSVYSEPGSSWAPQSRPALVHMGIHVHIGAGHTAGLNEQPFWMDGILQLYGLQRFLFRFPSPNGDISKLDETVRRLDSSVAELRSRGGGVIATGTHATEFVTSEMWDVINVPDGASREPGTWRLPRLLSPEESERKFQLFFGYVDHLRKLPGVKFVTARELLQLYEGSVGKPVSRAIIAEHLAKHQTFLQTDQTTLSAAECLLVLLGMKPQEVEGPASRLDSNYQGAEIPRWAFERTKADVVSFIRANRRLPAEAWIGSERLSILDFAATLAADDGNAKAVRVCKGSPEMETYWPANPVRPFNWAIHPKGFSAPHLVDLNELQAWTLKPARFK